MMLFLARHAYDARKPELRRLVLVAAVLLLGSASWYLIRPSLVYWAARTSLGRDCRAELVAAALRRRVLELPSNEELFPEFTGTSSSSRFATGCLPDPGWVTWMKELERFPVRQNVWTSRWQIAFADSWLNMRGKVASVYWPMFAPQDANSDGRWEVLLDYAPYEPGSYPLDRNVCGWLLVRLGEATNELLWAAVVDEQVWNSRGVRTKPVLRDEDGDGKSELKLITVKVVRLPGGGLRFDPPETIAAFEWSVPSGVLRPRGIPEDGSVRVWMPEHGQRVEISQEKDVSAAVRELLPLPDNFGQAPNFSLSSPSATIQPNAP